MGFTSNDSLSARYTRLFDSETEYVNTHTLLEYLTYLNSDKRIRRDYGAYLRGDFKLDQYRGADALAMHWYSRNLRIFRNIQRIPTKPTDRILVLYGAGHMGILKQLFECSPEYNLIKFESLKE